VLSGTRMFHQSSLIMQAHPIIQNTTKLSIKEIVTKFSPSSQSAKKEKYSS
jgi:hypothetical protein